MIFDKYKKDGSLLLEMVRGSNLYGLNEEGSDIDNFGIFIGPEDWYLGLGINKANCICSENNDDRLDEIGKFVKELTKSNPEDIMILFAPEDKIKYKNKLLDPLFEMRDDFINKKTINAFINFSNSIIERAKGKHASLNINEEDMKVEKTLLDFCIVPNYPKPKTVTQHLKDLGIKQEHCGVSKIPGCVNTYAVFYDYVSDPDLKFDDFLNLYCGKEDMPREEWERWDWNNFYDRLKSSGIKYNYGGIISKKNKHSICFSNIAKNEDPIFYFQYNSTAYEQYRRNYKLYWDRQKINDSVDHNFNYNGKAMMHCIRLLTMAVEMAADERIFVDRSKIDRNYLLKIKHCEVEYYKIIEYIEDRKNILKDFLANEMFWSHRELDTEKLNNVLINIRKNYYANK